MQHWSVKKSPDLCKSFVCNELLNRGLTLNADQILRQSSAFDLNADQILRARVHFESRSFCLHSCCQVAALILFFFCRVFQGVWPSWQKIFSYYYGHTFYMLSSTKIVRDKKK